MSDPKNKPFRRRAGQIRPLAVGHGGCFASKLITCEGHKVGYMYREERDFSEDSGWRFLAGCESDEFMDNPKNHGVYDVNTIANYDPDIIPFLDAPVGTAFERANGTGPLVEIEDFQLPND